VEDYSLDVSVTITEQNYCKKYFMLVVTWTINSDSSGSQQSIFQVSCVCTHKAILQFQFSVKYNNKKI